MTPHPTRNSLEERNFGAVESSQNATIRDEDHII